MSGLLKSGLRVWGGGGGFGMHVLNWISIVVRMCGTISVHNAPRTFATNFFLVVKGKDPLMFDL